MHVHCIYKAAYRHPSREISDMTLAFSIFIAAYVCKKLFQYKKFWQSYRKNNLVQFFGTRGIKHFMSDFCITFAVGTFHIWLLSARISRVALPVLWLVCYVLFLLGHNKCVRFGWFICLSVCLSHGSTYLHCANIAEGTNGGDSWGPKEYCIRWRGSNFAHGFDAFFAKLLFPFVPVITMCLMAGIVGS